METRATRRGLVTGVAGLLLLCLLLWFTLGDAGVIDPESPSTPADVSHIRSQGNSNVDTTATDANRAPLPPDARHDPIPAPREIAYGGRVLDGQGQPLEGLVPRLWGRVGAPSGQDGSFSVPLDPGDVPVSWETECLTFVKPGRQYPRVVPKPVGLEGKDEIWIPDVRGPQLKLWWLENRKPAAGLAVALSSRRGSRGRVLHEGLTDESGLYLPDWDEFEAQACLDVAVDGGTIRYMLERNHVKAHFPLHLFVPRIGKCLYLDIVVTEPGGRTVPDAHVDVTLDGGQGGVLSFVTDGAGRARAYYWLTDEVYNPSVAKIISWRVTRKTAAGAIRTVECRLPREERPSVRRDEPYPIVVGEGNQLHYDVRGYVPVLVRTDRRGTPVRPASITGETEGGNWRTWLRVAWSECAAATTLDPTGAAPRDGMLMAGRGAGECPDDSPIELVVVLPDRRQFTRTVTVGDLRRAQRGGPPLVIGIPEPVYCPRWLEVRDPDGKPLPLARCFVAVSGPARSLMTDRSGRAFLGRVPAERPCRIVVVDPSTGAGGEIAELDLQDAPEVTRLGLEPSSTLLLRLFRPNGQAPGGVEARLVDRDEGGPALAPQVHGTVSDDNLLTFPPAALSLYDLEIKARNVRLLRIPAPRIGESLVLE